MTADYSLTNPSAKQDFKAIMPAKTAFNIAVFEGDGIGHEITQPALRLLDIVCKKASQTASGDPITLDYTFLQAGANTYKDTGVALPDDSVEAAKSADAILLSCMGDPAIRYPDGTEIVAQIELRFRLGLFAGLRPVRTIPGVPVPIADPRMKDVDFVLVRESIEGLFAPAKPGTLTENEATETMLITREVSEKLCKSVFELAGSRNTRRLRQDKGSTTEPRVTCIDKANVFPAFAFFREIFYETAGEFSAVKADHAYVDAMAMHLVNRPWEFDVMVTENMFGDILSDLGAAIMGGMGYAPSADIGNGHAVFQPCHGTAPDIAGQGIANPTAMVLSGAMMLDWLAQQHENPVLEQASELLVQAVDNAFAPGTLRTCELGGDAGVDQVSDAVEKALAGI